MKLKCFLASVLVVLLTSCAAAYKPTSDAVGMRSQMTFNQAANIYKALFLKSDADTGFCAANGIPGQGILTNSKWMVNGRDPDFKINKQGFSVNAVHLAFHQSYNAQTGASWSTGSTRTDFVRSIKFADIDTVIVRPEPGAMIRRCRRPDGHTEITVEQSNFGFWFSLILKDEDVDRFVAAMMLLSPNVKFES